MIRSVVTRGLTIVQNRKNNGTNKVFRLNNTHGRITKSCKGKKSKISINHKSSFTMDPRYGVVRLKKTLWYFINEDLPCTVILSYRKEQLAKRYVLCFLASLYRFDSNTDLGNYVYAQHTPNIIYLEIKKVQNEKQAIFVASLWDWYFPWCGHNHCDKDAVGIVDDHSY